MYTNERAYYFLSEAEKAELETAHKEGRVVFMGHDPEWYSKTEPKFISYLTYRITKPKPSIDWDHVADWVTCMTTTSEGNSYHWEYQPVAGECGWYNGGKWASAEGFKSYRPGTCDWKDSLVMRPGVGK
jgi:hypothetical protein